MYADLSDVSSDLELLEDRPDRLDDLVNAVTQPTFHARSNASVEVVDARGELRFQYNSPPGDAEPVVETTGLDLPPACLRQHPSGFLGDPAGVQMVGHRRRVASSVVRGGLEELSAKR